MKQPKECKKEKSPSSFERAMNRIYVPYLGYGDRQRLIKLKNKYCLDKSIVKEVLEDEIHPMMYKKKERIFKRLGL